MKPTVAQAIQACKDIEANPYPYGPNVVRMLRNTRLDLEKMQSAGITHAHPGYCSHPTFAGDCAECNLTNYGRDCQNNPLN